MMDKEIIKETIKELENGKTNYDTCLKLSSLYILMDHMCNDDQTPVSESVQPNVRSAENIADKYQQYKDQYERGEIVGSDMMNHLKELCANEKQILAKAYSLAETEPEKLEFKNMLNELTAMMKP